MYSLYRKMRKEMNGSRIFERTEHLMKLELPQTFTAYRESADYTASILRAEGFQKVEVIPFPADGKTICHDMAMPLFWKAGTGRLTLLSAPQEADPEQRMLKKIFADYSEHPFHLIKGSSALPPGGLACRIVTEEAMLAGEDVRGALLLLSPTTWPRKPVIQKLLDFGAVGFITDFLKGRSETPDAIQWVTAATEGGGWHVNAADRPFTGFSISPDTGALLRPLVERGEVTVLAECDGCRSEGTFPCVTAVIPGRSAKEVWGIAHLFEPLADDDSLGVMTLIECARTFLAGQNEYTFRIVCSLEVYGLTAYAASRTDNLRENVIGACNFDSLLCRKEGFICLAESGPALPFCGNLLARALAGMLRSKDPDFPRVEINGRGEYFDDALLNDSTVGVRTLWPLGRKGARWHNSSQDLSYLDAGTVLKAGAFSGTILAALLNPQDVYAEEARALIPERLEQIRRSLTQNAFPDKADGFRHLAVREHRMLEDFRRLMPDGKFQSATLPDSGFFTPAGIPRVSRWLDYAGQFVPERIGTGFPFELWKFSGPRRNVPPLPDGVIYGPLSNILANMDGKKNLATLIREAEYERMKVLSDEEIKKYVNAVCLLEDLGYLRFSASGNITEELLKETLAACGIQQGDLLLVHTDLSSCGHITGGEETFIRALRNAAGTNGTCLFPFFNSPCIMLGGHVNKSMHYAPYDRKDLDNTLTGGIPLHVWKHVPDAKRSRHISHSWTGFGPLAEELLGSHAPCDSPFSKESPPMKALARSGKVLCFGTGIDCATLLSCFGKEYFLREFGEAVCAVKDPDGGSHHVVVPDYLPGGSDCDHNDDGRFFAEAEKHGLILHESLLGPGKIRVIRLAKNAETPEASLQKSDSIHSALTRRIQRRLSGFRFFPNLNLPFLSRFSRNHRTKYK